jgi:hypothetical protein
MVTWLASVTTDVPREWVDRNPFIPFSGANKSAPVGEISTMLSAPPGIFPLSETPNSS